MRSLLNKMYSLLILLIIAMAVPATSALAADRLELEDTSIVGTRELPKVLYVVPWKSSRLGMLSSVGEKGSIDDGMNALDRDLFRTELEYFSMLHEQGRQLQQ